MPKVRAPISRDHCDCRRCTDGHLTKTSSDAYMQPASLLIYTSMTSALPTQDDVAHLQAVARDGVCGRLAFDCSSDESHESQLLSSNTNWSFDKLSMAVYTDTPSGLGASKKVGCTDVYKLKDLSLPQDLAHTLIKMLQESHDVVVLFLNEASIPWLDELVMHLDSCSFFQSSVILSIVFDGISQAEGITEYNNCCYRPRQSYQYSGYREIDACISAVIVQRLEGIMRRDEVQTLCLKDIILRGGAGVILAERVLWELAYKVGRAPKYGA